MKTMITQRIDSISIKLRVHVYGSKAFIFHREIIIKQTLTYMESICLLYLVFIQLILSHGQVPILYYATSMTQLRKEDLIVVCNELVSSWHIYFLILVSNTSYFTIYD